MAEVWKHDEHAQLVPRIMALVGAYCMVKFAHDGEKRGVIERIESLVLGSNLEESISRSQFKVHLTAGDIVVVLGSAISSIEPRS